MRLKLSLLLEALNGGQIYRVVDHNGNTVDVKDVYSCNVIDVISYNDEIVITVIGD